MFVTVLGRLDGVDPATLSGATRFTDVKKKQYYAPYVGWANEKGIVAGLSDTTFGPEANITREQICAMMVRYCAYADITLQKMNAPITFKDAGDISSYAGSAVAACQQGGLVNGEKVTGGYNFRPQGNATRAEVATIMMNFAKTYK
ncbi:MAG: S-layer homology domain-containing protein [Clostridia bacterium]|nr:S-layer homology domain-containing protein [Clostridia bacterium]